MGTWEWVYSIGGDAYTKLTPISEGYTKQLEFQKNGVYKVFKNGEKALRSKYRIEEVTKDSTSIFIIEYKNIMFDNLPEPYATKFIFIGNDTLILDGYRCSDCLGHIYVRK